MFPGASGKNNMQVAVFSDRVANTALTGIGTVTAAVDPCCPSLFGTFTYAGDTLNGTWTAGRARAEVFL